MTHPGFVKSIPSFPAASLKAAPRAALPTCAVIKHVSPPDFVTDIGRGLLTNGVSIRSIAVNARSEIEHAQNEIDTAIGGAWLTVIALDTILKIKNGKDIARHAIECAVRHNVPIAYLLETKKLDMSFLNVATQEAARRATYLIATTSRSWTDPVLYLAMHQDNLFLNNSAQSIAFTIAELVRAL